jgi:hypothetical protein
MTRDDIIRMARETGGLAYYHYQQPNRDTASQFYGVDFRVEELERFAKLIVKETIDHMTAQMFYYSINGSKNLSFSQAIDKTKEHFGVKE